VDIQRCGPDVVNRRLELPPRRNGTPHGIRDIAVARSDPRILHVTSGSALYRSDDGGTTWHVAYSQPRDGWDPLPEVAVRPDDPNVVFMEKWPGSIHWTYSTTGGPDQTDIYVVATARTAFTHPVTGNLYLGTFCCGTPVHCHLAWIDPAHLQVMRVHHDSDCNLGFVFVSGNPHALWVVSSSLYGGPIYLSMNDGTNPLVLFDIEFGEAPRSGAFDAATDTMFLTVENWKSDRCESWATRDMGETWYVSDATRGRGASWQGQLRGRHRREHPL